MQGDMSIHSQYGIIVPDAIVVDGESISSGNLLVQATHVDLWQVYRRTERVRNSWVNLLLHYTGVRWPSGRSWVQIPTRFLCGYLSRSPSISIGSIYSRLYLYVGHTVESN